MIVTFTFHTIIRFKRTLCYKIFIIFLSTTTLSPFPNNNSRIWNGAYHWSWSHIKWCHHEHIKFSQCVELSGVILSISIELICMYIVVIYALSTTQNCKLLLRDSCSIINMLSNRISYFVKLASAYKMSVDWKYCMYFWSAKVQAQTYF